MTQTIKSILFAGIGAVLGAVICLQTGQLFPGVVVAVLGAFVGFGLSLPGTSVSRVLRGTAGMIVAHNVPGHALKAATMNAFVGDENKPQEFPNESDRIGYRELPRVDVLTVTEEAAQKIRASRPVGMNDAPLRIISKINPENGYFLFRQMHFETEWNSQRDVFCESGGLGFVMDQLSAKRLADTTLEWEVSGAGEGFHFRSPHWPRETLSREPWETETSSETTATQAETSSTGKYGIGVGAFIVILLILKVGIFTGKQAERNKEQIQQEQARQEAIQRNADELNAAIKRGDDVSEAMLILAGIDVQEYREYQKKIRAQKAKSDEAAQPGNANPDSQ